MHARLISSLRAPLGPRHQSAPHHPPHPEAAALLPAERVGVGVASAHGLRWLEMIVHQGLTPTLDHGCRIATANAIRAKVASRRTGIGI
jgi:hypothetical protein